VQHRHNHFNNQHNQHATGNLDENNNSLNDLQSESGVIININGVRVSSAPRSPSGNITNHYTINGVRVSESTFVQYHQNNHHQQHNQHTNNRENNMARNDRYVVVDSSGDFESD
jgi:hypothetical protein